MAKKKRTEERVVEEIIPEAPKSQESKWIKVSAAELADLQAKGLLLGYNPQSGEALVKEV